MKRHPVLIPLSREHHETLILARLLQKGSPGYKGLPADDRGKADYANYHYKNELIQHFINEESILPLIKGLNSDMDILIQDIMDEHQQLHQYFQTISDQDELSDHLDRLGKVLEAHVRKEERQLFPLIQDHCGEETLKLIKRALSFH